MTTYAWPGWKVNRFEMRVLPNLRTFTGPYTPTVQVIDLLGERWTGTLTLVPTVDPIEAAAREAFFDRLKGAANTFTLWHLKLPAPQGTLRDGSAATVKNGSNVTVSVVNGSLAAVTVIAGAPALRAAVVQGANTATVTTLAGKTVRAGDMLGLGSQLVRVMADATADVNGALPIEFQPRVRSASLPVGTAINWNAPTLTAMLKSDGVPTPWLPGFAEGASFDFIESL